MAKTKKWKTKPKIECKRFVKGRQKLCNHVISRKIPIYELVFSKENWGSFRLLLKTKHVFTRLIIVLTEHCFSMRLNPEGRNHSFLTSVTWIKLRKEK